MKKYWIDFSDPCSVNISKNPTQRQIDIITGYRIYATIDIPGVVYKGSKGGYIQSYENLSDEGKCWVAADAMACENSRISDNALLYDNCIFCDNSMAYENCKVAGSNTIVLDNSKIYGNCHIKRARYIHDNTNIFGNSLIDGEISIYENNSIYGDAYLGGTMRLIGNNLISNKVYGNNDNSVLKNCWIFDDILVTSGLFEDVIC